jgi:hypothetical protein
MLAEMIASVAPKARYRRMVNGVTSAVQMEHLYLTKIIRTADLRFGVTLARSAHKRKWVDLDTVWICRSVNGALLALEQKCGDTHVGCAIHRGHMPTQSGLDVTSANQERNQQRIATAATVAMAQLIRSTVFAVSSVPAQTLSKQIATARETLSVSRALQASAQPEGPLDTE